MIYHTPVRITINDSEAMLSELLNIIKKIEDELILDMSQTIYISSAGIRAIMIAQKSLLAKSFPSLRILASEDVKKFLVSVGLEQMGIELT